MKIKVQLLTLFLLLCTASDIAAQTPEVLIDSAATAYNNKEYAKAIDFYQQCEQKYGSSAALYANIGNSYAKLGDYGHAFIFYERSLRLNPGDKEVRNNREFILRKITDANKANLAGKKISVEPDEPGFFTKIGLYLTHSHTSDTWATWGLVMFLILCGCIAIYYFRKEELVRKIGFFGGISALFLCIVFNILAVRAAKIFELDNEGVIIEFKSSLKAEPFSSAKTVGVPLVKGTKLEILETQNSKDGKPEWYKVRLNSDLAGWIEASEFEII